MRKTTLLLAVLVLFALSCNLLPPPVTELPTATLTPAPYIKVVRVHLTEITTTTYDQPIPTSATAILEAWFEPQLYMQYQETDGSVSYLFKGKWESPNIDEMRFCFSTSSPCKPEGDWLPYVDNQQFPVLVDWLGPRDFWLVVEFRDPSGHPILADDGSNRLQNIIQESTQVIGFWDVATPVGDQPPAVQTALAPTLAAFPVTGSVVLEGGKCCAGGKAGSTIDITVEFAAASTSGRVTEMRVRTGMCFTAAEMSEAAWEPFTASMTIPVQVIINWTGFYISVQYRDEKGNLSPVYCDDISVEGMP